MSIEKKIVFRHFFEIKDTKGHNPLCKETYSQEIERKKKAPTKLLTMQMKMKTPGYMAIK